MANNPDTDIFKIPVLDENPSHEEPKIPNIRKIDPELQKKLQEAYGENVQKEKKETELEDTRGKINPERLDNVSVIEQVKKEIQKETACDIAYPGIVNMLVHHITKEGVTRQFEGQDTAQLKERIENDLNELYSDSVEKIDAIVKIFGMLNFTQEQIKKIPLIMLQDFLAKEMIGFLAACLSDNYYEKITEEQYIQLRKLLNFIRGVTVERRVPASHEEIMEFRRSVAKLLRPCFEFIPPHILAKLPEDINFHTAIAKIGAQEMQNPDWIGVVSVSSNNDFRVSKKPFTLASKVKTQKEHDTDKFLRGGYRIIQKEVENS